MNYRNRRLLDSARDLPCQICGAQDGTVVAAHSNQLRDGKGMGIKAHDYRIAALCFKCHAEIDQGPNMLHKARIEAWEMAHRKTMGEMFARGIINVTRDK